MFCREIADPFGPRPCCGIPRHPCIFFLQVTLPVKRILCSLLVCLTFQLHAAQKAYVTDKLEVQLRSGQSTQHKIVKLLTSGAMVTVLENNSDSGYTFVEAENGDRGWILTRYLSDHPVARSLLEDTNAKLIGLQDENKRLKEEIVTLKAEKDGAAKSIQQIQTDKDRLNTEVIAIRQASANALQIQAERDQLQESVIHLGRDLEAFRREKQAVQEDYRQNWFLIGAGVLLGGITLGLLLPRLSWRKRNSWGSF